MPRSRLVELEASGLEPRSAELLVVCSWLVAGELGIDEATLNAARRRAMFVLAAGGDPHRELGHQSVAAERLAAELDTPERRTALEAALGTLAGEAAGLPAVSETVATLRADPDLAWRSVALALLADELADE